MAILTLSNRASSKWTDSAPPSGLHCHNIQRAHGALALAREGASVMLTGRRKEPLRGRCSPHCERRRNGACPSRGHVGIVAIRAFLLSSTYLRGQAGLNKFKRLANQTSRRNGLFLLDVTMPRHPRPIKTDGYASGNAGRIRPVGRPTARKNGRRTPCRR